MVFPPKLSRRKGTISHAVCFSWRCTRHVTGMALVSQRSVSGARGGLALVPPSSSCAFPNPGGCGLKATFQLCRSKVADDAEDGPVNRWARAGAAASRCRSQERGRRPAGSRAGPLRVRFSGRFPGPPGAKQHWLPYSSSAVTSAKLCEAASASVALSSPFLVWQRRRCSGPAGSGRRFWALFLKAPPSAHSCSPLSDFVSAQPLNSLRALS